MQFKLSLFISALSTLVVAVPQGTPLEGVQTLCTGPNLSGVCGQLTTTNGGCSAFPATFQNDVSSFKPLESWQCTLYTDNGCNNGAFVVSALTTFSGDNDNSFNSAICSLD